MTQNSLTYALAVFLGSLASLSCASRPPVVSTYPLLEERVWVADGTVAANIPRGWSSAANDTLPPGVAAWLVSDDHSGMIALRELILDRLTSQRVREEGIELVARLSLAFRADSVRASSTVRFSEYLLRDMNVCGYELTSGGEWRSIIVVGVKGRYYECEASSSSRPGGRRTISEAQQAFLSSLTTSIRE